MPLTCRPSVVFAVALAAVVAAVLAAVLAAAAEAAAEPPLRVHFRSSIDLAGGGSLAIRGVFRPDGARVLVETADLPLPASGAYDVVVSAGDANLLDVTLAADDDGDFAALDEFAGDDRLEALLLDRVTLFDGDDVVGLTDDVETSAHLRFRADLRFESGGRSRLVAVAGRAGRRFDGLAQHTIKIVTGPLEPADYVVRLLGQDGVEIAIPFTIESPRLRRHLTIREWTDRLNEMARLHVAVLEKDGQPVATSTLGPID